MKFPVIQPFCFVGLLFYLLITTGCQGNPDGHLGDNDDDNQQVIDAAQRLVGKWKIDVAATKRGWKDEKRDIHQMERIYVDELTMWLQFNSDQTMTISKNERTSDGFWDVKLKSEDSVTLEAFQDWGSERKAEIKITFLENDQILFQSKEMDDKDRLIFARVQ